MIAGYLRLNHRLEPQSDDCCTNQVHTHYEVHVCMELDYCGCVIVYIFIYS